MALSALQMIACSVYRVDRAGSLSRIGYRPEADADAQVLGDLCEPEDSQRLASAVGAALAPTASPWECRSVEYQKLTGDHVRWHEARVSPIGDGAALLVTRDISHQKWAEQEAVLTRAVATAVSESDGLGSALRDLLKAVCDVTGWVLGGAWVQRMDDTALECARVWCTRAPGLERFVEASERLKFDAEHGLPGHVRSKRAHIWIDDVAHDPSFLRAELAKQVGLRAGYFVPVLANGEVVAVLEFFSRDHRPGDRRLLGMVSAAAAQLGSVIERKRVEESFRLLEAAVQQMKESVLVTSVPVDGQPLEIRYANAAFFAMSGYSREDLLGTRRPPERAVVSPGIVRLLGQSARESRALLRETTGYRKDGSEYFVEWHIAPIRDRDQRTTSLVAILRDVTQRRDAEAMRRRLETSLRLAAAEWRSTIDAIDSPIVIVDRNGRICRLNARAREMSGRSYSSNLNASILSVGPAEPWPTIMAMIPEVAESWRCGTRQVRDASSGETWDITVTPLQQQQEVGAESGRDDRFLVVARDVSRIVSLQESVRRTATMAAMGALVGGVAHEVRNPLFGMSATLDAFDAKFGNEPQYDPYLQMLRLEVERMTELMRELLEYGRPLGPALTIEPIDEIIRAALSACDPLAANSGVTVTADFGASELRVRVEKDRLVQVFQNLVQNAIQHSPRGGHVAVSVYTSAVGQSFSVVGTVRDHGPGFREEDLSRVFEPFFTRRRGGTGLGLSIVQRIIEQHGGDINARNDPHGGAVVTVTLPVAGEVMDAG